MNSFTLLLFILVAGFRSTYSGTVCLSCSGVQSINQCTHLENCRNDEVCFFEKYNTESGTEMYDLGCSIPKLCTKRKTRQLTEGHHLTCQGCCNNTNVCNLNTECGDVPVSHNSSESGRTCVSCTGVQNINDCTHLETCGSNEVCFIHKYATESGVEQYDFGCTLPELCVNKRPDEIFGKRLAEGHHMLCKGCCNKSNVCNLNAACDDAVKQNTSGNGRPRECDDLNNANTGVYTIYPDEYHAVKAYCIMANNEKWTVIQKRFNGFLDFYQDWNAYKRGFGVATGEYWMGNDYIHRISTSTGHKLSIYLEDFDGTFKYANYSVFLIGDEKEKYKLTLSGYTGDAGDSLITQTGMTFSTKDRDNDPSAALNCAAYTQGAWWYKNCTSSNLNGPYLAGVGTYERSMFWKDWKVFNSIKKSTMMITRT
ncbi:uncharacterized protein LOC143055432 [Mytilus galloprovincialis]|uniref:uncharacterized protein LOC143055432 n=1 Tax=Mytilus galloprovincialis TaxID=29158 RepID=UPI003F7C871E